MFIPDIFQYKHEYNDKELYEPKVTQPVWSVLWQNPQKKAAACECRLITRLLLDHALFPTSTCHSTELPNVTESWQTVLALEQTTVLSNHLFEQDSVQLTGAILTFCLHQEVWLWKTTHTLHRDRQMDSLFHFLSPDLLFFFFHCELWRTQITDTETDMTLKPQNETDHVSKIW